MLQILEDGRLTDGKGKAVNFKNTIIILTSNVGASTIKKQNSLGFSMDDGNKDTEYEKMKANIMDELKHSFRPEFLNRIDDIIVFHQLEEADLQKVVKLMLRSVSERLNYQDINIKFSEDAEKFLVHKGFDPSYGARPLRRTITKIVEDKISEEILNGDIHKGDEVSVTVKDNDLDFAKV